VTLISSTQARVKYDLSALGTKVATGASGTAVFQGGTWKVGDDVFCSLVTQANSDGLSLPVPQACGSAGLAVPGLVHQENSNLVLYRNSAQQAVWAIGTW
jgi:hypothetical protein